MKVVDSTTFKISTEIAAAEVTVEPGAMRSVELDLCKTLLTDSCQGNARKHLRDSRCLLCIQDYSSGTQLRMSGVTSCSL